MELSKSLLAFKNVSYGPIYKMYFCPLNINIPTSGIVNSSTGKRNVMLENDKKKKDFKM